MESQITCQFPELFQMNCEEKMRITMDVAKEIHSKMNDILNVDEAEEPGRKMMEELVYFLYVKCNPSQGVWLAPFVYSGIMHMEDLIMMTQEEQRAALVAIRTKFSDSEIATRHPVPTELDMMNLWHWLKGYEEMLGP